MYPGSTLPATHPSHTPGTPPHAGHRYHGHRAGPYLRLKDAVGLKSVRQLTLDARISGFRGITEVYNLVIVGNPNDHKHIPSTE